MGSRDFTLEELAEHIGARLEGDSNKVIVGINTLSGANNSEVSFFSKKKFLRDLTETLAGAIIISQENSHLANCDLLIMDNPYLGYAKASHLFKHFFKEEVPTGISRFAEIGTGSNISKSASVGSFVSIGKDVVVGDGVLIGNGSFIGNNVTIGSNSVIYPNTTIYSDVSLGVEVIIHSGSVIGSDGLGFAKEESKWVKVEHLGEVIIGDRVEIGSNTSIDKGSIGSTIIGSDVKIDNLVHIAHNVQIGDYSAIAASSAIAGSTIIGKKCTIAGCCGVIDNITIVDNVNITAMTLVTKSIKRPGIYSSGTPIMENREWKKNAVKFKKLYEIFKK